MKRKAAPPSPHSATRASTAVRSSSMKPEKRAILLRPSAKIDAVPGVPGAVDFATDPDLGRLPAAAPADHRVVTAAADSLRDRLPAPADSRVQITAPAVRPVAPKADL